MIGRKKPSNLVYSPQGSPSPQASAASESPSQAMSSSYESSSGKPLQETKSSWIFNLSWILNLLTMLAGGLGLLVNIISMFRIAQSPMQVLTRFFALNMCLLVVLTEFESPRFFSWFGFLESWIGRGMGSIFTGALLNVLHHDPNSEDSDSFLWIIVQVSSIYLIIVGSLYCFFGALWYASSQLFENSHFALAA